MAQVFVLTYPEKSITESALTEIEQTLKSVNMILVKVPFNPFIARNHEPLSTSYFTADKPPRWLEAPPENKQK